MRRVARSALLSAVLLIGALSGCGGAGNDGGGTGSAPAPRGPSSSKLRAELDRATKVDPGAFPAVEGRTLRQLADSLDGAGPQIAFATQTLVPGEHQRLAFGVIDKKTGFVYAPTAVYVATGENKQAQGPFTAPADLLVTDPPFRSRTAASESDPFAAIYQTSVPFRRVGTYPVLAVVLINGKRVGAAGVVKVTAAKVDRIPDVGEAAPTVDTDTVASAGGDISKIDTRVPPSDMHAKSLKDVLGKRPVALLFATPQLCQSRVCGPVVDIAAQLKKTYGNRMQFIHQEVYVDNEISKGLRPPLQAFQLPTEPWLFVIDRSGKITARLEGSFGFRAFESAIKSAL